MSEFIQFSAPKESSQPWLRLYGCVSVGVVHVWGVCVARGQGLLGDLGGGVRVLRGSLSICYVLGHAYACVVRRWGGKR